MRGSKARAIRRGAVTALAIAHSTGRIAGPFPQRNDQYRVMRLKVKTLLTGKIITSEDGTAVPEVLTYTLALHPSNLRYWLQRAKRPYQGATR